MQELERTTREHRKEAEALAGLVDAVGIRNGVQCKNWVVDQQKVMALLNKIPVSSGGTLHPTGPINFKMAKDGYCDPSLAQHIRNFQQMNELPVVDGVVDPGGATFKLLSAGGRPASSSTPAYKELEFYDNVDVLTRLLDLLLSRHAHELGPTVAAQLRIIKQDLERMASERKLPPRPKKPLPVQNNVGVIGIGIAIVVVIGIGIIAISLDPTWRKHANIMVDGIAKRAEEAHRLIQEGLWGLFGTLADGIARINDTAYKTAQQGCRDNFNHFERKSTKLTFELSKSKPNLELIRQATKEWLDAFMSLIKCMGPSAYTLIVMLHEGWKGGRTIMDIIVKILGGDWQPPMELARR
jgi:hypothetical protein